MSEQAESLRGRFSRGLNTAAASYVSSLGFDRRLWQEDIIGSIAHARMLGRQGIITAEESRKIVSGLLGIKRDLAAGKISFDSALEDIHMNIEALLAGRIGEVAGKLHTARSRNDQVTLDLRIFLRDAIARQQDSLAVLRRVLVERAEEHHDVIMPGYTHLQRAQPILFAHHLLAYFSMFQRDMERLEDCLKRVNILPLGSGALAGVTYPIDRESVAAELGFNGVSGNSLDAVSDRDYVIEYEAAASLIMMHLSRLAEELILWTSAEFGFAEMDDAFSTSSSIMPQKKNADMAELARGKAGRVFGHLVAMLTTMKGLPLAYDRDNQEDKEGLFDAVDTVDASLEVMAGMVRTLTIFPDRMREAAGGSYALATDIADYLAGRGMPFRQAHSLVAKLVKYASQKKLALNQLSLKEYKKFSNLFDKEVLIITLESSVEARAALGGTSPGQVKAAIKRAKILLGKNKYAKC
jgi:argininosuccinate lyase